MSKLYRLPSVALFFLLFGVTPSGFGPARAQSVGAGSAPAAAAKDRPELIVQLGHVGQVLNVAVSHDGRYVLTGGDLSVFLWEADTGQIVRQFGGRTAPVAVAFSPDRRFVLTGGLDGMAHLWDAATGREVKRFVEQRAKNKDEDEGENESRVLGVAFSPEGRSVLTRSPDGVVRLWDVSSGKETRKFAGLGEVFSAAYSPDGRFVLIGANDGDSVVRLYSAANGKEVRRFADGVYATFSPDGRFVLAALETTVLYEAATGKKVREFKGTGKVLFSPDGRYVLTPNEFAGVSGINVDTGERLGVSDTARLWDATSGALVREFNTRHEITSAAFIPDGHALVLGTDKGVAHMFEVTTGRELRRFDGYVDYVREARFSPDGRFMTTESIDSFSALGYEQITRSVYSLWNFAKGQQVQRFVERTEDDGAAQKEIRQPCTEDEDALSATQFSAFAFSPDGNLIATGHCKFARLRDVATGRELRRFEGFEGRVSNISFSPDGHLVALGGPRDKAAHLLRVDTGAEVRRFVLPEETAAKVGQHEGGQLLQFVTGRVAITMGDGNYAFVWDTKMWKQYGRIRLDENLTFSSDFRLFLRESPEAGTAKLHDTGNGKEIKTFKRTAKEVTESDDEESEMEVMDKKLSPNGRFMATGSVHYTENINPHSQQQLMLCLLDVETGKQLRCLADRVTSFTFTPDSRFLVTSSYDRTTRLWDVNTLQEACRLLSFRDGTWVVVTPDGRFDTNNLDNIPGLHWVFPDEPLRPLPLEIFLRDYFEPRLLPRLIGGALFKPIRPLASLNRAQPQVRIVKAEPEPGSADRAAVTVEVAQGSSPSSARGGQRASGVYDLHLFRDGQLVGRWPDPGAELQQGAAAQSSNLDLSVWRRAHGCKLAPGTDKGSYTFHNIQLPRQAGRPVEFTAYAFNSDRVKSATSAPRPFTLTTATTQARPRAYVITVGVNANESDWNLDFAVQSAHDIQQLLRAKLSGQYEVIDMQLLSALEPDGPRIALEQATKANIQAVLDLLADRPVAATRRQEIDPQHQLRRATPDDLVVLFISSHGYADPQGNFYVIPADTGEPTGLTEERLNECLSHTPAAGCAAATDFLARSISSDDLASWWNDVDAGEMLMILDSCHAAAVPGREFKPGPLGDRGFGQLSYDKGMRILTATQPDKTARATLLVGAGHSLLTDALINALTAQQQVSLAEWLQEAEWRVPVLYRDLYQVVKEEEIQYPVLLDFTKKRQGAARVPAPR